MFIIPAIGSYSRLKEYKTKRYQLHSHSYNYVRVFFFPLLSSLDKRHDIFSSSFFLLLAFYLQKSVRFCMLVKKFIQGLVSPMLYESTQGWYNMGPRSHACLCRSTAWPKAKLQLSQPVTVTSLGLDTYFPISPWVLLFFFLHAILSLLFFSCLSIAIHYWTFSVRSPILFCDTLFFFDYSLDFVYANPSISGL